MANGRKSFLDHFRITDDDNDDYDEDDDYIFDDDDDDYDDEPAPSYRKKRPVAQKPEPAPKPTYSIPSRETRKSVSSTSTATDKLVSFEGGASQRRQSRSNSAASNEVYVIKPQEFDDAQTVSDFLKKGKAIVINMEGLQLEPAQRIIDFIGGACYGMGGELKAISANIFIAVPSSIEVSGDLREEILNSTSGFSPHLG